MWYFSERFPCFVGRREGGRVPQVGLPSQDWLLAGGGSHDYNDHDDLHDCHDSWWCWCWLQVGGKPSRWPQVLVTLAYAEKVGLSLHNFTIWVFKYGRVRNLYFLQVLEYYDFQTERSVFCMRVCLMTTMISGGGSLLRSLTGFLGQRWSLVRAGRPNFHPKAAVTNGKVWKFSAKFFWNWDFILPINPIHAVL